MDELGGPAYLNNMVHAKLLAPELNSRPHPSVALRDIGVTQVYYKHEKHIEGTAKTRASGTAQETELDENDYVKVWGRLMQYISSSQMEELLITKELLLASTKQQIK